MNGRTGTQIYYDIYTKKRCNNFSHLTTENSSPQTKGITAITMLINKVKKL